MRILIIGGIAKSLKNFRGGLIKILANDGHEVLVTAGEEYPGCKEEIAAIGARFIPSQIARAAINPLGDIKLYYTIRRIIKAEKIDVVLSYTVKPVIFGSLAAKRERVPRIISLITGLGYAFSGTGSKAWAIGVFVCFLYRIALHRNNLVIFQNKDNRQLFLEKRIIGVGKDMAIVDGSGVDVDHFMVEKLPSSPSFLMIARLIRDKGVVEYTEAARIVRKAFPLATISLLGRLDNNPNSITNSTLESWITEGVVDYLGGTDDVRPAISACSIYVLPSYSEGLPRTVLEAMAMGRAIVTTDVPGCRETIENAVSAGNEYPAGLMIGSNGLLVPPRNSEILSIAMTYLAGRPELVKRMGSESRRIVERRFASRKIDREMVALIIGAP
jgi:glycosyltransferase involved in cell wall biosynthesis